MRAKDAEIVALNSAVTALTSQIAKLASNQVTQPGPPSEESVAPESVADDAYPVKRTLDHIAQTHCSEEGDADEHVHKAPRLHGTHIRNTSDGPVRQSVTTTSAGADASTPTDEAGDFTAQLAALLEKFQSQFGIR